MLEAGKVFKGQEFIADVKYQLSITTQYDHGVLVSQESHLRIQPATAINPYIGDTDKLTLLMRDGKKQDFYVASLDECKCTGGPY
jgi:hypothetical protein